MTSATCVRCTTSSGRDPAGSDRALARDTRRQGWWTQYDDLQIPQLIGLEQEATVITCFAMFFVPALLQTEDYATAIIKGIAPRIHPDILRQRVEARMRRQQLLDQPEPPRYRALLDEAALHRQVGGTAIMNAQLGKILQLVEENKATVQVIPYTAGAYASVDSNFTFLDFDKSPIPGLVFVEGLESQIYLEKASELARYTESIEFLRDSALDGRPGFSGPAWRTARNCDGGACVQVAASGPTIMIADSKAPRRSRSLLYSGRISGIHYWRKERRFRQPHTKLSPKRI